MASPTILHIDMDAFFAAVEQLDNPALKGQCVIVGGASDRGVVAAASYEARRYGIHSAMPIFQARQRCSRLVIVPPRRHRYAALSTQIMSILETFSPLVEPVSIDEAYVDIGGCGNLHGTPRQTAIAIKAMIHQNTRLTCSVGAAPCKFLAKIASDMNKPNGLTIITPEQVAAFIENMPIRKVPGVGARAQQILARMGITTLGQIRGQPANLLNRKLGKFGLHLMDLAHGRDHSPVTPCREAKSFSSEITLDHNTRDQEQIRPHLLQQAQAVARQLRRHQVRARTVTLKLKTADFQRHSRSQTLKNPVQDSESIYRTAAKLLDAFPLKQPVRLIGVGAGALLPMGMPVQCDLFAGQTGKQQGKWEKVDQAVDAIVDRFGGRAVTRGTLTPEEWKKKESTCRPPEAPSEA
jgi:DNA polymerase-4